MTVCIIKHIHCHPSVVDYKQLPQKGGGEPKKKVGDGNEPNRIEDPFPPTTTALDPTNTQQTLANLCSFPGPWTVSRLETRGTDSLSTLEIVCGAFGIEVITTDALGRLDRKMSALMSENECETDGFECNR